MIVIDVETTGLSRFRGHRIIELGAVHVEGGVMGEEFHCLIDCGHRISKQAQRVHGITDDMLRNQPEPRFAFSAFRAFISQSSLIAHNAPFDLWFLRQEFSRQGWRFANRCTCTLEASRRLLPELGDYRLASVARHLFGGLPPGIRLHRALDDARLTAMVWLALEKMSDPEADQQRKIRSATYG